MARSIYEKAAHKELQEQGYIVDYKARPFRVPRGYTVDYFGLFDLLCWDGQQLRAIAIKGHGGVPNKLRKAIENFSCKGIQKEIWTYDIARKKEVTDVKKEIIE